MKQLARHILIAIPLGLSCLTSMHSAQAQITSDGTVPTDIKQSDHDFEIQGGSEAGGNLFHSFQEFSVPTGSTAFFNNSESIANIISRVTGDSISNIDGLIKANGGANLILINPSGIYFGPNAQLDIGGSFLGSTASSVTFEDGTEFSATNPQAPLLTIAVPVGLQMGQPSGTIQVQGQGHNFTVADPIFAPINRGANPEGLSVKTGNTLGLVGSAISLDGGLLTAEAGSVELGSVTEGRVKIESLSQGWSFNYDQVAAFGELQLRSRALADASGLKGGSINLQGGDLSVQDGSLVLIQNQGTESAGTITLQGSDSITVSGTNEDGTFRTSVNNQPLNSGPGGDINLLTEALVVAGGASIVATTFGSGAGGDINVDAVESIQMLGASPLTPRAVSSISSATLSSGDGGDTNVSTQRLTASEGGIIASSTLGTGRGGNLNVTVSDQIEITGVEPNQFIPSGLAVTSFSDGKAGNLTVDTSQLTISQGGRVDASALARGDGGSLIINASEFVAVQGTVPDSVNPSLIASAANEVDASVQDAFNLPPLPTGNAGNLTINTPELRIDQGAQVTVRNDGSGDAGSLTVKADRILLNNQGGISAATVDGNGGSINLQVEDALQMTGFSQIALDNFGSGEGGNLKIDTSQLNISEGAFISGTAFGEGEGGNLSIRAADTVEITGTGFEEFQTTFQAGSLLGTVLPSDRGTGIFIGTASEGAAGNLTIETPSLHLNEGAIIFSPTFTNGIGGNIAVEAPESVELSGSAIQVGTSPESTGAAGTIAIDTRNLVLENGAVIINATFGDGAGGNVAINASESIQLQNTPEGALLLTGIYTNTTVGSGAGGDLKIDTRQLSIRNGVISSNTGASLPTGVIPLGGPGGNIIINASEGIEIAGIQADTRFPSGVGTTGFSDSPSGDLTIDTQTLIVKEGADVSTAALGAGEGGTLTINASESIELIGTTIGDLTLGGLLAASGRANLPELEAIGNSGDIRVQTEALVVRDGASIDVQSLGPGETGNLDLIADSIFLDNQGTISAASRSGEGGNINLQTDALLMRRQSQISATAGGTGNGGNIALTGASPADLVVLLEASEITANAFEGMGGNITIDTRSLFVCSECQITASSELGVEGLVSIDQLQPNTELQLIDIPQEVAPSEEVVDLACSAAEQPGQSQFIMTGRGGLPPRPTQPLSSENLVDFDTSSSAVSVEEAENSQLPAPAQGWYINSEGILILSAQAPSAAPYNAGLKTPNCHDH
ncbi:MAG: filamentous hemagglutinin N-terminal domain-containing protein [Cyanobacteria bacterium]|jgi:filamentous hemagglutinin family protein|nr:filamentous hemagglutinin N-terminal domain-containing protein [Cyanobacteria bacterium GSL.Bin21]